jgi:predicted regulator of Ras-like GTPase activity (Roadblock/LC7/MglB family)
MGFFSKLFGGKDDAPQPASPPASTKETKPVAPATARGVAPATASGAPAAAAVPVDNVTLTLKPILAKLPQDLQGKVKLQPGKSDTVIVPIRKLGEQLQQGSVKVPLGEFAKACPPGTFEGVKDNDQTMVELPLAEVIAKAGPNALRRRTNQKKVEVPDDIGGLFGTTRDTSAPPAAAASAPAKPAAPTPPPAPAAAAPAPAKPAAPPPPAAPSAPPAPAPQPSAPLTISPALKEAMSSAQAAAAPKPAAPPPTKAPAAPSAPAAPAVPEGEPISVPLAACSAGWPDAVKQEIASAGSGATLSLPRSKVADGLKTGKVAFTWKQLRSLVRPNPLSAASPQDDTTLDIPLSVVAPIFMASHKQKPQKKVVIDENIPGLFAGGKPAAAPAASPAPAAAPAPAPAATPAPAPAPAAPSAAPAPAPSAATATPAQMVQRIVSLPGVVGAVIALQDGLPVAHQVPAGLKGDTVASFVPQIFARLTQYTKEMNLGELHSLTLQVDGACWEIIKSGNLYVAAMGKAGGALPSSQLKSVAMELARENKK